MKKSFLYSLIFLFFCQVSFGQRTLSFTIKQLPEKHKGEEIFIACNCNNWNPGDTRGKFKIDSSGIYHFDIKLPEGNYEYKFTRGDWSKGESTKDGKPTSNRTLNLKADTSVDISIEGWGDDFTQLPKKHTASVQVSILDSAFVFPQLNTKRRIWIYLPTDYYKSKKKYAVLYMHDGQNLFDAATAGYGEWGIDECLDSLFAKGKKECIVIGIDNSSLRRMNEYNPNDDKKFGKGEGNLYIDFLVNTLKPFIDSHYRTLPDKENTFIAGSSMGGLISFYAVLKYPKVFGGAGVFSPSFWIAPGLDNELKNNAANINSKLFFYVGGKEGETMVHDMQRIESELKALSKSKMTEIVDADARHNEIAWRKYFPQFYNWITSGQTQ